MTSRSNAIRGHRHALFGALWLFSIVVHAAPDLTAPADLPPAAIVNRVLAAHPDVLAAQARVASATAEGRRLHAGEYEYQARAGYTRRHESGLGGMNDWEIGIERGLRLPGKAKLDAETATTLAAEAEERVADARHEAARDLLVSWYAVLRGEREAESWREQTRLLRQQRLAVEKRFKAGDAADMERSLAEAALRQAEAETRRAETAAHEATARLSTRFPGLPAPLAKAGALPVLSSPAGDWVNAALEHNHELAILQKEAERTRIQARRQQADLTPDPTLGLHFSRERSGQDNLLGLSLTLPLPGEARRARVAVFNGEALALAQLESGAKTRIESEMRTTHARLQGALNQLEAQAEMARQLDRYAALASRAYELGESPLWETINARKAAQEARREVALTRLLVDETAARLLLDSHQLWSMESGHAPH